MQRPAACAFAQRYSGHSRPPLLKPGGRQRGLAVTIAAAALLSSASVYAWSAVPGGHACSPNLAIELFILCVELGYGDPRSSLNREERERIVDAHVEEDRTRLPGRVLRWHF